MQKLDPLQQGVAPAATGSPQDVAPAANRTTQGVATASNIPVYAAAQRKEKAAIDNTTLTHLINNTIWRNPNNVTVEENELKLILGFDPTVFTADMLHKIFGKLGFVSRKFMKVLCLETILKAVRDLKAYECIETNNSNTNIDSTSPEHTDFCSK
jgi:hypothetical protein